MPEPLSPFVGLGLGVVGLVPPALKLIEFWADFIKNARQSGDDATRLSLKFEQISLQYRSLTRILFDRDKWPFVNGVLFDSLPSQEQNVIQGMLKELPQILYEYYTIVQAYHRALTTDRPAETAQPILDPGELQLLFESGSAPHREHSATVGRSKGIWWAARTKKKIERLIAEFEDWLDRIKSTLESCWWPLSFFERYVNVQTLEKDEDCISIGIAGRAGVRKLLLDDARPMEELNLGRPLIKLEDLNESFHGMLDNGGTQVFVEILPFEPDKNGFLPELLKKRFCKIASMLYRQADPDFRTLHCKGYFEVHRDVSESQQSHQDCFVLVSKPPEGSAPTYSTLLDAYAKQRGENKPELGERLKLCYTLARSLSLFHSIGGLHRNFRSENVLFFQGNDEASRQLPLAQPFICGFEAARFVGEWSMGHHHQDTLKANIYRHRNRWGLPNDHFNMYHDIYALGVVLLEIGLWEEAANIIKTITRYTPKYDSTHIYDTLTKAAGTLGHRCGRKFQMVVEACLTGSFGVDDEMDTTLKTHLQAAFQEQVLDVLADTMTHLA